MIPWICSKKHKEYISEAAGPHSIAFKPTLRWHRGQVIRRSRRWASALKFGSAGSTRVACPTSVPERLELYGEARPKPPTLRRRAPKNSKNPSGGWGESFLDGIWVAHKRLQEQNPAPPPVWRVPKIGKKCRFDTFFGRSSALVWEPCKNAENAVNTNTFWTRDAQNTANTSVFESKAKKHCKLQHFWRVDHKKC